MVANPTNDLPGCDNLSMMAHMVTKRVASVLYYHCFFEKAIAFIVHRLQFITQHLPALLSTNHLTGHGTGWRSRFKPRFDANPGKALCYLVTPDGMCEPELGDH